MKPFRPIPILRIEGALVFAASLALYQYFNGDWRVFAWLFFAPDISIAPLSAEQHRWLGLLQRGAQLRLAATVSLGRARARIGRAPCRRAHLVRAHQLGQAVRVRLKRGRRFLGDSPRRSRGRQSGLDEAYRPLTGSTLRQKLQDQARHRVGLFVMDPVAGAGQILDPALIAMTDTFLGESAVEESVLLSPYQQSRRMNTGLVEAQWKRSKGGPIPINHRGEGVRSGPGLDIAFGLRRRHGPGVAIPPDHISHSREAIPAENPFGYPRELQCKNVPALERLARVQKHVPEHRLGMRAVHDHEPGDALGNARRSTTP